MNDGELLEWLATAGDFDPFPPELDATTREASLAAMVRLLARELYALKYELDYGRYSD